MNRGSSRDFGKKPMTAPSTPGGASKVVPIASLNPYQSKLVWKSLSFDFLSCCQALCAFSLCRAGYELRCVFSRWTIRARITNKSAIRTWSNSRGDGKLFSLDIVDESVRIYCFKLVWQYNSVLWVCYLWLYIDCCVYREKLEWLGLIRRWTNSTPWSNRGRQVVSFSQFCPYLIENHYLISGLVSETKEV